MNAYRRFKEIVPSKAEEKKLCGEFEEISGYSSYRAIKKAKDAAPGDRIINEIRIKNSQSILFGSFLFLFNIHCDFI